MRKPERKLPDDPLLTAEPLYKQVKARIIQSLTADEWKPGSAIPSESRLAELYSVGISTVRAAIAELVAARVLIRRQGKGTFVSPHTDQRSIYQFFHVVNNNGERTLPVSTLVSFKKMPAEPRIADLLNLPRSSKEPEVYRIRNVLTVSDVPAVVSDVTISTSLFKGLNETIIRNAGKTLYAMYQSRYGINVISTTEELRAVKADAAVARILEISAGDPVLEVFRVAYTFDSKPIEVRRGWVNTKDFYYFMSQGED